MCWVEGTAGSDEYDSRPLRPPAAAAEFSKIFRRRGVDALGSPGALRRGEHRPGSHEYHVCTSAQEAHDEPIGLAFAGDQRVRARKLRDRDDPVDRLHEVREDARLVEADPASVEPAQLGRQVELRQARCFEKELERCQRWPILGSELGARLRTPVGFPRQSVATVC